MQTDDQPQKITNCERLTKLLAQVRSMREKDQPLQARYSRKAAYQLKRSSAVTVVLSYA